MSNVVKSIMKTANKIVKPRTLKVISICSVCGQPVNTNKNDLAYRHGFKRYKKRRIPARHNMVVATSFSQEDDRPCAGSGQEVIYKRVKK